MKSLVEAYLKLPHRKMYETIDLQSVLKLLRYQLGNEDLSNRWIYFSHSDPIYFCLGFLEILDRGGAPIAVPSGQSLRADSWFFAEGHWVKGVLPRQVKEKGQFYAVPTSGTTGSPKICEFDLDSALKLAQTHALAFGCNSELEIVQTLPAYHSYGIIAYILAPLAVGCGVNFCPSMMGLRKMKKDKEARDCIMHVSPSQMRFILKDGVSVANLKKITIGGGSVTIGELDRLQKLLNDTEIYVSYGLTEAGPRVSTGLFTYDFVKKHSLSDNDTWIGSPLRGVSVMVSGEQSETSMAGRLWIKSPYIKRNTSCEELNGEWLITRDQVQLIGQEIFFLSRQDDLIKFGGLTIYPRDIEQVAITWPQVSDVIVLKTSDTMYGERPLLFLEGNISKELANELLHKAVNYANAFAEIFILEKFPRQSLEKVNRTKLLEIVGIPRHD